jgi:HK97 family phage prohead protease
MDQIKSYSDPAIIKDVDTVTGTVKGYFSVFGNIDSDGDMITPGAFKRTLQHNAGRIKHLWQHDTKFPLAIPKLEEDAFGLAFESVISKTSYGRDVLQLYLDGVIGEHSIGFQTVQKSQRKGYTEISEVKLWEGSSVTFGSNMLALGGLEKCLKALRHGKFENENIYEDLESAIKKAISTQPAVKALVPPADDEDLLLIIKKETQRWTI